MDKQPADYDTASDESLVLAALVADFDAFDTLITRYRSALILVAQGIVGSRAQAEDIAQDTFVAAFQTLPSLEDPAKFGGWVRTIARFRALRASKRERRITATDSEPLEAMINRESSDLPASSDSADPAKRSERQAEQEAVWDALNHLSPDHREALYLHYCEEWSLERIAEFLSIPESTVKGRLFRGREALRKRLVADSTFTDRVKGTESNERNGNQKSRGAAAAPDAEANVHAVGAFQPDGGSVGGRGVRGRAVQPHCRPAGGFASYP